MKNLTSIVETSSHYEIEVVEDTLKLLGEPIRLKDLVELTEEKIQWGKNPSYKMNSYMKISNSIVRSSEYGKYEYTDTNLEGCNDDMMGAIREEDAKLLESFRADVGTKEKRVYRVGEIVEGRVTGIEDYGAFICNDDETMQGLIHITNVRNSHVSDLSRYFKIGDRVSAKIVSVKPSGKLALSTKESSLPDYFANTMEEKMKPIQLKTINGLKESVRESREDKEKKQVIKFIEEITGVVSEPAKKIVDELIESHDMFTFMMALTSYSKEFKPDLSEIFAKGLQSILEDGEGL